MTSGFHVIGEQMAAHRTESSSSGDSLDTVFTKLKNPENLADCFTVIKCISKNWPSSVYLVQSLDDDKLYVLKKTECMDESKAIAAFQEELELKKLNHTHVCGYKDFFITYIKQSSSMYINIITQYFSEGNLQVFIKSYQDKQEAIPEHMVKKILGEILEGLVYIHESGFVHRNIKPSNIYQKDGGVMILGDLGVSTLMGDVLTNTRQTFLGTLFMAPEIVQQPHDEKSDLFSVGAVILNMLTTNFLSEQEFYQKFLEIKESPEVLSVVLETVSETFSKPLVNTVQTLLRHKNNVRPFLREFIKAGFIQECMAQVDSTELKMRSMQFEPRSFKVYPLADKRDDIGNVLEYLADTMDNETCAADGLSALADIVRDNDKAHELLDQTARNLVSLAMWDYIFHRDVQIAGCYILSNLVVCSKPDDILFTPEVVTIVHKIMNGHEFDPEVQLAAADLILALSADEKASGIIVQYGGIQDILRAMRHAPYHASLCAVCCLALWSLTVDSENLKIACKENAANDVCLALKTHKVSPEVCEAAAAALLSLLLDDSCYDAFIEQECTSSLVAAIHLHSKNAKVVKNCCKVLATVVESSEECAYEFLSGDAEDNSSPTGIPTVMEAYRLHKDNADVVESIVRLLLELSNYDDIRSEMRAALIGTLILSEVSKRHKHNTEIMQPVQEALVRLGSVTSQTGQPRQT
ncbi:hypothetical protein BsWGS_08646 [Bradybaena similaris]